jgi:hypothetical protein
MSELPTTPATTYDDPHTPLHKKPSHLSLLKKLRLNPQKSKKLPKSPIPLTERNLTEFFNPDYTEIHDAYLAVRPQRKVSVSEWLQLLP